MHVRQVAAICLQLAYNLTNEERVPICLAVDGVCHRR